MVSVDRVSQYALYSSRAVDRTGLWRLTHTLRLEGDYVGAQAAERELSERFAPVPHAEQKNWTESAPSVYVEGLEVFGSSL